MRVAVVGAGSIGRRHIGNLIALGCEVTVSDPDEAQLAEALRLHPDAKASEWPKQADAWVIASPHRTHLTYAEDAINRRIPLFVEKPLGSLDQLPLWRRLAKRAEAIELATQVGYNLRFHPLLRLMREQFKEPTAGGFYCDVNMSTWLGHSYGPWLLECSHEIDAALWCGAPTDVADVNRVDATAANIWLGEEERWLVALDAHAETYHRSWRLAKEGSSVEARWHAPEALGSLMYYDEMLHFIECVRESRQTDCPLRDGVTVLDVCQQVEQMARKAA